MKIERQIKDPDLYEFWRGHRDSLPSSLRIVKRGCGYEGYRYFVTHSAFAFFPEELADISHHAINIRHAAYFQDVVDFAQKYEQATGHEIIVRYWQNPKDSPLRDA